MLLNKQFQKTLFSLSLVTVITGCVENSSDSSATADDEAEYQQLLINAADNVIQPQYQAFATRSKTLNELTQTYCQNINTANESVALAAVQQQWLDAAKHWQKTELHIVGNVSEHEHFLKNKINVFSDKSRFSSCLFDKTLINAEILASNGFDISKQQVITRGLPALEYLFFNTDLNHSCAVETPALTDWDALSDLDKQQHRCNYAVKVAKDLQDSSNEIVNKWDMEQANYRSAFISQSNLGSQIKSLSDALFYIDKELKDLKVLPALPADVIKIITKNTPTSAYVEEYPYSQTSLAMIKANLQGLKAVFFGNGGYSFDDIIIEQDFKEVADRFENNIDAAIAVIDAMEMNGVTLTTAAAAIDTESCTNALANPDTADDNICKLFGYSKRLSDSLKSEFVSIVNLDLPNRAQADND